MEYRNEVINILRSNYLVIISLVIVLSHLIPILILGENAAIGVHDTFDSNLIWYKVLADSGMVFAPSEAIVPGYMAGLPRISFGSEFYFLYWLIAWFGLFGGYMLNLVFMHLVGFFGMYLLLKTHVLKEDRYNLILLGVSICFAILPIYPPSGLSVASLPLALYALLNVKNNAASKIDWALIILIPFYSSIVYSYFFFLSAVGIFWLFDWIKERKPNLSFFSGIALMSGVFVFVEYRLFASMIFGDWFVSHRTEMTVNSVSLIQAVKIAITNLLKGHYHVLAFQIPIILITILVSFAVLLLSLWPKTHLNMEEHKPILIKMFWLILALGFTCIWYGFWQISFLAPIKMEYSIFRSFQFDRYYWLQPMLWYVLFAISLLVIQDVIERIHLRNVPVNKLVIVVLILLQIGIVYPTSWAAVVPHSSTTEPITFREFYATDLFNTIKDDIGLPQQSYYTLSIGLHPAIAKYNGFYTLDGYSWNYPLEYKHKFRHIIAYELEKNPTLKSYFDDWGNRCYTFVDGLDPGELYRKDMNISLDNVQLNVTALHEMNCSYIFSAVNITNYETNGLQLFDTYETQNSAWRIFLYEVL